MPGSITTGKVLPSVAAALRNILAATKRSGDWVAIGVTLLIIVAGTVGLVLVSG
jgi:hypothetical protein